MSEHSNVKDVINRLSSAEGHIKGIKKMVEEGRDCDQIIIQISAVRSALNEACKVILDEHMEKCLVEDIKNGQNASLEKLKKALGQYLK